jgi:type IV pilus assembly protein PilM
LRNVAIADSASLAEIANSAHLLGEPVGLALRTVRECPMQLNLRPASVIRRHQLERQRPFLVAAAACFILGLLALGTYYARVARTTRHITEQIQQKIDTMRVAEGRIGQLRKQIAAHDSVAVPLIAAINDRSFWVELLEELNARLPKEDIWITELIATSNGKPVGVGERSGAETMSGPASAAASPGKTTGTKPEPSIDGILGHGLYLFNPKQQEVVTDYFRSLTASSFFKVDPDKQSDAIEPTVPNNAEWAFPYTLKVKLSRPMKLP